MKRGDLTANSRFLTKDREGWLSLAELGDAWTCDIYITGSELAQKRSDVETVTHHSIIKLLSKMTDNDKQQIYEGGLKEHRDKIKELNVEINQLKKEIEKLKGDLDFKSLPRSNY